MTLDGIQQQAKLLLDLIYSYESKKDKKIVENARKVVESLRALIQEEKNAGR